MDRHEMWYNLDFQTAEELRNFLQNRKNFAEEALSLLSTSTVDYISNFGKYVTAGEDKYCVKLLKNHYKYKRGNVAGKGKVGTAAILRNGNVELIIKSMSATEKKYLSLRIFNHPGDDLTPWNSYWQLIGQDGNRKIITAGGDNFANQTSMHIILGLILGNQVNYVYQYDAFYCSNYGYNVMEYCNSGDLHGYLSSDKINVTNELMVNIISQVLTPLAILKDPIYSFNHSDLKAKNVFVQTLPSGEAIFKIADYDKSSITWNGIRFYNNSNDWNVLSSVPTPLTDVNGITYYQVSSMISAQLYTMHNPYGIPMSYDVYTFIISLFAIDKVWDKYHFRSLPILDDILEELFGTGKFSILGKIVNLRETVSSLNVINSILNGVNLKYDVSNVYRQVSVDPPLLNPLTNFSTDISVSEDGHLCLDVCSYHEGKYSYYRINNDSCKTNTYSKRGTLYDWDYCSKS